MTRNIYIGALGLVGGLALAQLAPVGLGHAQDAHHCDYTFIKDADEPNIGSDGDIKYDKSWQKVLNGGWSLKAATGIIYIFEKCR
jgi:hypothetical protein